MKYYLRKNLKYRKVIGGSNSPNVEDAIFRLQGKVLNNMYKLPSHKKITTSLDFGCGQGSTVNFFHQAGYDAYGIDICKGDIEIAKKRYPYIADKFKLCKPDVFKTPLKKFTDNKKISLITGHRSLMYFDKEDFEKLLKNFNNSMTSNGLLYASMLSTKSTFFQYTKRSKFEWLRERVSKKTFNLDYMFFCESKKDVVKKFSIFKKMLIGSYHYQLDENDKLTHYYQILCKKK